MKKKLVVYLAGLLTVLSLGFGQAQFSDVPAGHWAKEAVERVTACGFISGFPDGTFRGNANLTRYQVALILQRLLTELQKGGECVSPPGGRLSEEDLMVIRNAVQELSAELAALGVRVSALEDNAASKDDIARLEAAIEELRTKPALSGMDEAALADLADRIEAASVAADTALAQAQVLAERLDAVEGDLAALKTQAEADSDSIRALNELAVLLNQDVLSLQDRVTALEKQLGDADFGSFASKEDVLSLQGRVAALEKQLSGVDFDSFASKEDVSALQEFATALRSDLVRLSDRVSELDSRVSELDKRLTAVEGTRPSLTGSLLARYGYRTRTGVDFDIDRLFPDQGFAEEDDNGVDKKDLAGNSDTQLQADLTFSLKRDATTTADFNLTEASAVLRFTGGDGNVFQKDTVQLRSFSVAGNVDGQPLTLRYSDKNTFRFTPYFMNNSKGAGRGALVTFSASRALLAPTFTVALGSFNNTSGSGDDDYFGIRGELDLLGLRVGIAYGEVNRLNFGKIPSRALVGGSLSGKLLGLIDLQTEAISSNQIGLNAQDTLFYAQAGVPLGPVSLRLNYRSVAKEFKTADWTTNTANSDAAGLSQKDTDRIFDPAAAGTGGGVIASAKLGILGINGYLDSKSDYATQANSTFASGVGVSADLFVGFGLTGYLNSLSVNNTATYSTTNPYSNQGPETRAAFGSNLGARLTHDGSASNALIRGLNLALELRSSRGQIPPPDSSNPDSFGSNGNRTDLVFELSYPLSLGPLSVTPDVRYHKYTKADDTPGSEKNYDTFKWGIQASTQTLDLGFIKPSLSGNIASRNTNFETANPGTASETRYGVDLSFADFLLPGATFSVKAAQVQGTNVDGDVTGTCKDSTFSVDNDCLYNGSDKGFGPVKAPTTSDPPPPNSGTYTAKTYTLKGLFLSYTYAGLGVWYGVFELDKGSDNTVDSVGRGFRIFYKLNF